MDDAASADVRLRAKKRWGAVSVKPQLTHSARKARGFNP
jgi:hypothetical protein